MNIYTSEQIAKQDKWAQETLGLSPLVLMESVGASVTEKLLNYYPQMQQVLILAGAGNNGGDALVVARHLHCAGVDVEVCLVAERGLGEATTINTEACEHIGLNVNRINAIEDVRLLGKFLKDADLVVDGLLGTGFRAPMSALLQRLINRVNSSSIPIVSIDIPSGVVADTGEVAECAVNAVKTVAVYGLKPGHLLHPGAEHAGEISYSRIGLPSSPRSDVYVNKKLLRQLLWSRPQNSHKYSVGRAMVIAGSRWYSGAAVLAAKACCSSGAGLTQLAIPDCIADSVASRTLSPILLTLESSDGCISMKSYDGIAEAITKAQSVLVGPGLTSHEQIRGIVREILKESRVPLVLDADALNVIQLNDLQDVNCPLILTPHKKELERLTGKKIENDYIRWQVARELAEQTGAIVVAKGAPTIIVTYMCSFFNSTGNAALSVAGTGDVLAGLMVGILAQGVKPEHAAVLAVYLHGLTADIYVEGFSFYTMQAEDVVELLPEAYHRLFSKEDAVCDQLS